MTPGRTLKELRAIISNLPKLGKDTDRFLKDVEEGMRSQPPIPERRHGSDIRYKGNRRNRTQKAY
jgi:hypothetical protein